MPVPSSIADLSTTAASNSPDGAVDTINSLDNYQRAAYAFIRQGDARASVASASTVDLGAQTARVVSITGTTTITSFGTVAAGIWRLVTFAGALTLTHNGTSLILPGAANIATAAGDTLIAESLGSGNWVVHAYWRRAGAFLGSWSVDSSGRLNNNGATQPRFAVRTPATRNSSGTFTTYSSEDYDVGTWFDASTGVATCPVAGLYLFTATVYMNPSTACEATIRLGDTTGAAERNSIWYEESISQERDLSLTLCVYCPASTQVSVRLTLSSGTMTTSGVGLFTGSLLYGV